MELITQLLGLIGLLIHISRFQINDARYLRYGAAIGKLFFGVHFFLLGFWPAFIINCISATYDIALNIETTKNKIVYIRLFFGTAAIACSLLFFQAFIHFLPLFALILGMWANAHKNAIYIRFWSLTGLLFAFLTSYFAGSLFGMISDILSIASILIAILRYDLAGYKQPIKSIQLYVKSFK
jgi:hypothetical protein